MRIFHVNNVANVGSIMVQGLNQLGHNSQLFPLQLPAGQKSTFIKFIVSPLRLKELITVNHQIKHQHPDVVHIHFAYLGMLGVVGRYPFFLHCHGGDIRNGLRDPLRRKLVIQSITQAKEVFFVTPDLAPTVRALRSDAIFLPNPVNTSLFSPLAANNQLKDNPVKILIISALNPIKKVNIAFESIQKLITRYPDVKITAIDKGIERKYYYHTQTNFISPVPHHKMPELINAHDIIIGQFGIGSLGMSELEGMACGKPVICHSIYNNAYPDSPPVFSANSSDKVVEHLSNLIENPALCHDYGKQGRDWVLKYHDHISIAKRLEEIYYHYLKFNI